MNDVLLTSNPMYGTTAVAIRSSTEVVVHVADFDTAKRIRDYISSLVTAPAHETGDSDGVIELLQYLDPGCCDCQPCHQCGRMPVECSGTECASTCQCSECDHCRIEYTIASMRLAQKATTETCATPERPFAWYRERVPVGYHIHVGDWPPPEPDDTAWQPLYLTPGGIPAKETGGRPVRPHRSGGQPVAPAFRDERLHRIDKLMDAEPGTPEGAELDKLVDEQVNAEKAGEPHRRVRTGPGHLEETGYIDPTPSSESEPQP